MEDSFSLNILFALTRATNRALKLIYYLKTNIWKEQFAFILLAPRSYLFQDQCCNEELRQPSTKINSCIRDSEQDVRRNCSDVQSAERGRVFCDSRKTRNSSLRKIRDCNLSY